MNKRNIGLFSCLLLAFLVFVSSVTAAPTAVVISPNGGEVLSGEEETVTFTVEHTAWVTQFDANVGLSYNAPGLFDADIFSPDLNLLDPDVCGFDTIELLVETNDFSTITFPSGNEEIWGKPNIFLHEGSFRMVVTVGENANNHAVSYTYNTSSNAWEFDGDYNAGLPSGIPRPHTRDPDIFTIDDELYMLYSVMIAGVGGIWGWKYNTVSDQWETNSDINAGLAALTQFHQFHFHNFEFEGEDWLILQDDWGAAGAPNGANPVTKSYKWNGATWVRNSLFEPGFTLLSPTPAADEHYDVYGSEVFVKDGSIYKIESVWTTSAGDTATLPNGLVFDGAAWVVSDINLGLTGLDHWAYEVVDWSGKLILFRSADAYNGADFGVFDQFEWNANSYDTKEKQTCTVSFDTTEQESRLYYLDVKAFDNIAGTSTDSSDARFEILNWTDSDITCDCISNCSSCTLDVNAFVVVPTDQTADIQIKVENLTSGKNVGYRIQNSENNGKQYKIHTANSLNFVGGLWAFNDTLTFGTTNYEAVQKIWQVATEKYHYEFAETLVENQIQYYKFDYFLPAFTYSTLDSAEWDNELLPDIVDLNQITSDLFSVSTYSDIGSFLISPRFPNLTSDLPQVNYVFQFTASADSPVSGELKAGIVQNTDSDPGTTLNLASSFKTLTVTNLEDGYMKLASAATTGREFYFQNYTIIERGYFTKPIEVFDTDGTSLPVLLHGGTPWRYVAEGKNFIVDSEYYDPEGEIDRYEITAYIGTVTDANRVKKWVFDASDLSGRVQIRETVGDLIDLTASAANREIKLALRLVDTNGSYYEIQSASLLLVQFPFFPNDFRILPTILNKKVGFPPKGTIDIFTKDPNSLRGVRFSIWQTITGAADISDYNTVFYKDVDFSCTGFDCGFDYEIDDWLFPSATGTYALTVSALLSTELPDWNSALTSRTIYFKVYWKDFDTARIFETIERNADHTYRNDEPIPLVMQLRDTDFSNMKEDIKVHLTLSTCDAATAGTCVLEDLNYNPTSFLYDAKTGYNYFFWSTIFIDDNGSLLSDGNYYRVMGTISDAKGKHETLVFPYLAPKCQTYDTDCTDILCFFPNMLASLNHFLFGCTVVTSSIVTTAENPGEEGRVLIDADHSVAVPTQECLFCYNTDQNNVYMNQLEQELLCGAWYTFNEAPIDNFRFFLTNENSDLSKVGDDAQYISVEVPFEKIAFNDLSLMIDAIHTEFGTTPDTVGELVFHFGNSIFTGIANPVSEIPEVFTANGIITNVGVDCNFTRPLSTEFIDGLLFFKMKGIKVINQQDYLTSNPEVEGVETSELISYLNYRGVSFPIENTSIEVYASDGIKILEKTVPSPLVINVPYSETSVRQENVSGEVVEFESLPSKLRFTAINDLIYNGERATIRRYVPFTITAIISPGVFDWSDAFAANFDLLLTDPGNFIVRNWFLIGLTIFLIIVAAGIYAKVKSGGQTVNINNGES